MAGAPTREAPCERRARRRPFALARAAIVPTVAMLAATACDAIGETERAESPTGGVELSLQILRTGEQQYELYRVTAKGEIEYGGGMRAFNDTTGWTGALTPEDIRGFLAVLDETGWCANGPVDDPESPTRVSIAVRCESGRHTYSVRGESESVRRMAAFLEPIARRRLDPELDRLPDPDEPPLSTPTVAPPP